MTDTHGDEYLPEEEQQSRIAQFNKSEFALLLGMEIVEARPGYAKVVMEVNGKRNQRMHAHGGALFSLADHAFGVAANLGLVEEVALAARISYLSPAEGLLTAVAQCVGETDCCSTYSVHVFRDESLVATFEGQGIRNPRR
ncbi:MAG: PaaI family thioesterase [Methanolinea sp.]|jgi:acyl-CoA thioesterase